MAMKTRTYKYKTLSELLGEIKQSDIDRFWSKVDILDDDECWNWKASLNKVGYGQFFTEPRLMEMKSWLAHRFCYAITYNNLPNDLCVCHHCDNRKCVNPKHLFLGTNYDNVQDKIKKNRLADAKGENNANSKLKEKDIVLMRIMNKKYECSLKELSALFGVAKTHVSDILRGNNWKHIEV